MIHDTLIRAPISQVLPARSLPSREHVRHWMGACYEARASGWLRVRCNHGCCAAGTAGGTWQYCRDAPRGKEGDGADLTKAARRAAYMRFLRAQRDNPQRPGRGNKMPPEIVDKIRQDPPSSTSYFNLWLQHGEDWGQVQVVESRTSADSKATAKQRQWTYACQIHAKWPNEAVARRHQQPRGGARTCPGGLPD